MISQFLNLFRDPDDRDPSYIRLVRNILIFTIIATAASIGVVLTTPSSSQASISTIITLIITLLVEIAALYLAIRGLVLLGKIFVPVGLVFAITIIASNANSLHDISILALPIIIIVSNLLQGRRSLFITTPLVIGAIILLGIFDMTGRTVSPLASRTGIDDILIGTVLISSGAGILNLLTQRLRTALAQAEANEHIQAETNRELRQLQDTLEKRVADRTAELELANQNNEKRAKQFEAIAQVARAITLNEELDTLLPRLVALVSEQFGFYHTGIFLMDEKREYAVLRAANSEGGRRMLARGHKLKVGQIGMVGFVSATGKPRIALDVGIDAVYFDNPDLPNTHSEMALPLRLADEVVGVLDIQSTEPNAFQEDDVDTLSTLADQVAIALQNARTYESTQELLKEAQKVSGSSLGDSWRVLQTDETMLGYRVTGDEINPLTRPLTSMHVKKAVGEKLTVTESGRNAVLAVPIRLRDEVIGVVNIRTRSEHEWDEDEVDIAEAVAERLSLALETSLLLKSTQRRAEIERITADISGKIGATTQFDSILRTAAEELSRVLGGSEVLVQIQSLDTNGTGS